MNKETITLYHNPRCSKSQQALALLKSREIEPVVVDYLKIPPSQETLQQLLNFLAINPIQLARQNEPLFEDLQLQHADLSLDRWLDVLHSNPVLIQRPIVVVGQYAAIGRPLENIIELLDRVGL